MRQLQKLRTATELAQDESPGRNDYLLSLLRSQKYAAALQQVDLLLASSADSPRYLTLKGAILVRMGNPKSALDIFEAVLKRHPLQAPAHLHYGHTLKTVGRFKEAIAAYRRAIQINPAIGEAYWSLANLKTFKFTHEDIESMRMAMTSGEGNTDNQSHLAFAMGKALEDRELFDESFRHYQQGNAIRGKEHHYDPDKNRLNAIRTTKTCTEEFFAARHGGGSPSRDPIFIVGLPRSGSTLLEQILASHSMVEGTAELPDIIAISRKIGGRTRDNQATEYPEILAQLSPEKRHELGESYLTSATM
jgi:tetratricopeptide (TPR) repeat protein